jgi:predicted GIY-YIG superfamily endonuclease
MNTVPTEISVTDGQHEPSALTRIHHLGGLGLGVRIASAVTVADPDSLHSQNLLRWALSHGSKNQSVIARAYELTSESRSNLLGKGTVIVTNGREQDLASLKGALLKQVLERGSTAQPVKITGLKSKLRELPDFWPTQLGDKVRIRARVPKKPSTNRSTGAPSHNYVVYAIKNRVTGRMYFGSSNNVKQRWASHRRDIGQLRHTNYELLADAVEHGADSFKFMVLWRFATRKEMLRREQLLIAMYFNRDACYNLRPAVIVEEEPVTVEVVLTNRFGGYASHSFLTLHAAIRHYRLSKVEVREAIRAGHGKVGNVQFPTHIPITHFAFRRARPVAANKKFAW